MSDLKPASLLQQNFILSQVLTAFVSILILFGFSTQASAQGAISNGDSPTATISPIGDVDSWTFTANDGDSLRIQIGEISGTDFEPLLRLIGPDSVLISTNGGNNSSTINHQAILSGTYTVQVLDNSVTPDGTGSYALYLARVPGSFIVPVGDEGGALTNGGVHAGSIDLGDMDIWTFEADAQDTVRIGVGEVGSSSLDPFLLLYGPDGSLISSNANINESTDITYQATTGGTYTVIMQDGNVDATGSGDYQLYFSQINKAFTVPVGDQGGALSNGGIHAGTIALGDMDIWTFEANALDSVRIAVGEVGSSSLDPFLLLYGPDGNLITSNSNINESTNISHQAMIAGTYTVIMQDGNVDVSGSGDYQLYFTQIQQSFTVPVGDEGGVLSNGGVHAGTIELGDMDIWTFEASALDSVRIAVGEVGSSSLDPFLLLYGPDGNFITSNSSINASTDISHQAVIGGTYTVIMQDGNVDVSGSGDYQLYFTHIQESFSIPVGDEGGVLNNGDVHAGTIDLGDMDIWTFEANALDSVRIAVGEVGSASLDPFLLLYGPDGNFITSNSSINASTDISHQATIAGTYTVVMQDGNVDVSGTGAYQLYFTQIAKAFSVPAGDEGGVISSGVVQSGAIDLADMDIWTVQVDAQDTMSFVLDEVGKNNYDPFILLYDPQGNFITSDADSSSSVISHQANVAGTYTVVVQDGNVDVSEAGDYELTYNLTEDSSSVPSGGFSAALSNGGVLSSDFSFIGDADKYSLAVNAGDQVRLRLADTANSGFLSPTLQVFNASGTLVSSDTNSTIAEVAFTASANETLSLVVFNSSASAGVYDYSLYAAISQQGFIVPAGDEGGALTNGGVASGVLTAGDIDMYSLAVNAGDYLRLRLADVANSGFLSTAVQVFASDGSLLASNSSSTIAQISLPVVSNDTLTITVRNATGNTGSYSYDLFTAVSQQSFTTPGGDEGGALVNGGIAAGVLSAGDIDLYSLPVIAGDYLRLRLGDITNSGFLSTELKVFAADGSLLASNNSTTIANAVLAITNSETLTVMVQNSTANTGNYNYELYTAISQQSFTVPGGDEGGALFNGDVASGLLTAADVDLYSLAVEAGDYVRLRLGDITNSGFLSPALQVFSSNGSLLATDSNSTIADTTFRATSNETVTVAVRNDTANTGTYGYELFTALSQQGFIVPATDQGGVIDNGMSYAGVLTAADTDIYSLSVAAGDSITLTLNDTNNSGFLSPAFQVYRADGSLLAFESDSVNAQLSFIATDTEALAIVVRNATTNTGSYDYSLLASGATVISDTDGDGLADTDEVLNGSNINRVDTDSDGLTDGEEVNTVGSNPLLLDTDGDSFDDLTEFNAGSDPTDPLSIPVNEANVPMPWWSLASLAFILIGMSYRRRVK